MNELKFYETKEEILETLIDALENVGWSVRVYEETNNLELEQHTLAGEDYVYQVDYHNGNVSEIATELRNYARNFDRDEHIALWINSAGENGVPNIDELYEDAKEIENMLNEVSDISELYAGIYSEYVIAETIDDDER